MFSTIIRVCCDGGMGNTHIGSRRKDWFVERECKGYLRRGRDKSSVTTKIVALQPQGWEVVNNNYPRGYFSFNSGLDLFHAVRSPSRKEKKRNDIDRQGGNVEAYMQKTCDVAVRLFWPKKIAEKVRKSRQNVNRDKSA